jgi:hypothetical protein
VLIGARELQSMLDEQGEAIVRCDFCTREYRVNREQLQRMIDHEDAGKEGEFEDESGDDGQGSTTH